MASLYKTDSSFLICQLREEIGGIIFSWVLYRHFKICSSNLMTNNVLEDLRNPELNFINAIVEKFKDELISRLAELANKKHGQLNFYFAANKLKVLREETYDFIRFIESEKFLVRRNKFISHKHISSSWEQQTPLPRISYKTIVKGVTLALVLMKKFDVEYYGKNILKNWHKIRQSRYNFTESHVGFYLALPYIIIHE